MEFLFSNYPPVKSNCKTFVDAFYDLLPKSSRLDIAVGYISSDALIELKKIIELNKNIKAFNLTIGMHFFDLFTKVQYNTAMQLNDFLMDNDLGEVKLVTAFKYHGKLYSYSNDEGPIAGIIGSDNLGSIIDGGVRLYESSFLLDEDCFVREMNDFILQLSDKAAKNISEIEIADFNNPRAILEEQEDVTKLDASERASVLKRQTDILFEIPVKTEPKSNLNCYHGKGRENKKTKFIRPRHWYEVELIVPKAMRMLDDYPKGSPEKEVDTQFRVYTDDGFSFMCQVNGGSEEGLWNKNLRSSGDLTILGKWIKGRLENEGVLKVGDVVTDRVLEEYGRNTITMTKLNDSDEWYLDFGVER